MFSQNFIQWRIALAEDPPASDAYLTIGKARNVDAGPAPAPARRVFPCSPNMLAGPEPVGLLVGFGRRK